MTNDNQGWILETDGVNTVMSATIRPSFMCIAPDGTPKAYIVLRNCETGGIEFSLMEEDGTILTDHLLTTGRKRRRSIQGNRKRQTPYSCQHQSNRIRHSCH